MGMRKDREEPTRGEETPIGASIADEATSAETLEADWARPTEEELENQETPAGPGVVDNTLGELLSNKTPGDDMGSSMPED
jgi:hypothetical protein